MFIAFILPIYAFIPSVFTSKHTLEDTSLKHLKELNFQHGYPVDVFGGIFATFAVSSSQWSRRDCILDGLGFATANDRCRQAIEALYGVHGSMEYDKIMRLSGKIPLREGQTIKPDENTMNSWTTDLYNLETLLLPNYAQLDITPERSFSQVSGLINSQRLEEIREAMDRCVESLLVPLEKGGMLEWACGYAEFLAIMHETSVSLPSFYVIPRTDASEMSGE